MPLDFDPIEEARLNWERRGGKQPVPGMTSIMRAHQIMLGEVNAILRPFGLNFARYELLMLLTFAKRGALPLGKIGERLQVHPTSVTNTVDRCEQDGFVMRVSHDTDRRTTLAEITPKGRKTAEEATTALRDADLSIRVLSGRETKELVNLIRKVRMEARDFVEPATGTNSNSAARRAGSREGSGQPVRGRRS